MAQVDRVAQAVKNLAENTDVRLNNLEAAVGQLNELFAVFRVAASDGKLVESRNGERTFQPAG